MMQADPACPRIILSADAADHEVGTSVLASLSRSRQISVEEIPDFFDLDRTKQQYEEWVTDAMTRYGYKTRRSLFKGMKNVTIRLDPTLSVMVLRPLRHDRLESWIRTKGDGIEDVVVPAYSSPSEIGAALRVAFSRCT
jgi:hypothetical protein